MLESHSYCCSYPVSPENFDRGVQLNSDLFLVDEGREDSNTTKSGP